jgi:hypothetical protein
MTDKQKPTPENNETLIEHLTKELGTLRHSFSEVMVHTIRFRQTKHCRNCKKMYQYFSNKKEDRAYYMIHCPFYRIHPIDLDFDDPKDSTCDMWEK